MDQKTSHPKIKKLEFERFESPKPLETSFDLKQLNDVSLELLAELGRTSVSIREILAWKKDTIVTLNKLAGENVDIFIHGVRFASGEVLVVEDKFAVRLTELLSYIERVKLGMGRVTD
ncbi:MAG TPA: FliM/FliN family flagellar motor switch protein [archaeon]|nr:FliM/FliN family flagellar motor switch protein [archaeon]